MSEFDNVPPPPATTDVPADQRTMALAAHLLGIFTGFVGLLFMPLAGAMAGEYWSQHRKLGGFASPADHALAGRQATRVGVATWIGQLLGTVVKLVLVFLMIGVFAVAWLV